MHYKIDPSNHDWVTVTEGRHTGQTGIIVRNECCGGVFRGHFDVFFGEVANGQPVLWQLYGGNLKQAPRPEPPPFDLSPIEGKTLEKLPVGLGEGE